MTVLSIATGPLIETMALALKKSCTHGLWFSQRERKIFPAARSLAANREPATTALVLCRHPRTLRGGPFGDFVSYLTTGAIT